MILKVNANAARYLNVTHAHIYNCFGAHSLRDTGCLGGYVDAGASGRDAARRICDAIRHTFRCTVADLTLGNCCGIDRHCGSSCWDGLSEDCGRGCFRKDDHVVGHFRLNSDGPDTNGELNGLSKHRWS